MLWVWKLKAIDIDTIWFWIDCVLDGITYCLNLSKNRSRSCTVQGCPHLHVRERDWNCCDLKHLALLHTKTSTRQHLAQTWSYSKANSWSNTHVLEEGKQLFSHCLHSWDFHFLPLRVFIARHQTGKSAIDLATPWRWFNPQRVTCLSRDLSLTPKMFFLSPKNFQAKHSLVFFSHNSTSLSDLALLLCYHKYNPDLLCLTLHPSKRRIHC